MSALCQESGLSQDNLYHIKCAHPRCHFHLKFSNSKTAEHLSTRLWCDSFSINDHVISKYKSSALDCNYLAGYFWQYIKNGVTSQIQLHKILMTELGCTVSASPVGHVSALATSKLNAVLL